MSCECKIEVCAIDATECGGSWHTTIRTGYQATDSRLVHFKRCFECRDVQEQIADLKAELEAARKESLDLLTEVNDRHVNEKFELTQELEAAKRENVCTCGSGGHPRRCAAHPQGYDLHVLTLNYENAQNELATLSASLAEMTKENSELRAMGITTDSIGRHHNEWFDKANLSSGLRIRELEADRDALTAKVSSLEAERDRLNQKIERIMACHEDSTGRCFDCRHLINVSPDAPIGDKWARFFKLVNACEAAVGDIESNDFGGQVSMATLSSLKAALNWKE